MIYGIGVDVAQIDRFAEKTLDGSFVQRIYSPVEQQALSAHKSHRVTEGLAGAWAAKEAFLKAAGTGIGGFAMADIQLLHEESGRPVLALSGDAAQWMQQKHLRAHVSISHDGGMATAFVILEENGEDKA